MIEGMYGRLLPALLVLLVGAAACAPAEPPQPRSYALKGQVLAINTSQTALTVKHDDIEDFMMGMTMTFPVEEGTDLSGLTVGDTIEATLEVAGTTARLRDVKRTGSAPLPANTNEVALAAGLLEVGDEVPDAALIDQADNRRSLAEWTGMATIYGFTYTTCPLPNFCPLIDRQFAALQARIAADPDLAARARIVSVSIDPEHDTPAVLAAHAEGLGANHDIWTFLTGDVATVDRVAGRFGVGIVRPEEGNEISHNLRTTLVGPDGRVAAIYPGGDWTVDQVLDGLRATVD